ncbi:hypothetical protein MMC22_000547 [Lobaria immixta]|nr:hypothetical protein [Lobaria immixta]
MAHERALRELSSIEGREEEVNPPLLDPKDRKELTFVKVEMFKCHVHANAEEVLATINSFRKDAFELLDTNKLLYKKEKKYVAANEQLIIDNAQLAGSVALLEDQLAERVSRPGSPTGV